jgi:molybdate transport system substrate-binding protein
VTGARIMRLTAPAWFAFGLAWCALTAVLAIGSVPPAHADELRVAGGGAVKPAVGPLMEDFARETGQFVKAEYAPMGALAKRLAGGESFDVLIMTPEAFAPLVQAGKVARDALVPLGKVGIGIAVNEHASLPDIGTPEALKRTLLQARSIVYIDPRIGTSGKYVAEMIERLGIADQMKAKTTLGTGGMVVEPVGRGEIELGIHQISEILPVKGIRLVGELPAEFQRYTTYAAAIPDASDHREAAQELIRYLTSTRARERFREAGLLSP